MLDQNQITDVLLAAKFYKVEGPSDCEGDIPVFWVEGSNVLVPTPRSAKKALRALLAEGFYCMASNTEQGVWVISQPKTQETSQDSPCSEMI